MKPHRLALGMVVALASPAAHSADRDQGFASPQRDASVQQGRKAQSGTYSSELIRKVQQALREKGHDAGPVDGIYGPLTQRGVRSFQETQSELKPTGRVDAQTLTALGIEIDADAGSDPQDGRR